MTTTAENLAMQAALVDYDDGVLFDLAGSDTADDAATAIIDHLRVHGFAVVADDGEARHVVDFTDTGWTMQHPLACRSGLFACPVNVALDTYTAGPPPAGPGRYPVELGADDLPIIGERI